VVGLDVLHITLI